MLEGLPWGVGPLIAFHDDIRIQLCVVDTGQLGRSLAKQQWRLLPVKNVDANFGLSVGSAISARGDPLEGDCLRRCSLEGRWRN